MNYWKKIFGSLFCAMTAAGAAHAQTAGAEKTFWLPEAVSADAASVDDMFYFIIRVAAFFFISISTTMFVFIVKYRRRKGVAAQKTITHSAALELTWSFIPLLLLIGCFYYGFTGFMNLRTPPKNAYEILVTGQKWAWMFTYPTGYVDENLHVPIDTPVVLTMTSQDVIHSMFIPSFRVKQDVVPGRYTKVWFRPVQAGEYDIFCTEYCGTGHSTMHAMAIVHKSGDFENWLREASNFIDKLPPAEAGRRLYKIHGCAQCHSVDGRAGAGPSLKNVYGTKQPLKSGQSVLADENYIRKSIMDPAADVVAGYDPVMPTFKGRLSDKEITVLIEYLKTLSDKD